MNSSMNVKDFPKKVLKHLFRKHLMIPSFLNLKRKITSMNEQEFSLLNTTRKYFGSKIAHLTNFSKNQADCIKSYFRYFREVIIDETTIEVKSLGNIGIRNQRIKGNSASIRRILSICPCKVSIVSSNDKNTKWWLSMPIHIKSNIKHLKITFSITDHKQLFEYKHLFKDFKNIESCTICLTDDYYDYWGQQPRLLPVGFIMLCRIKTLKSLELDLSGISISRETLTALLNEISKNEPERWYLKVFLNERFNKKHKDYPIEIAEVKSILNKLDFLSLTANHPGYSGRYRDIEIDGYLYNDTNDLSDMKHLTEKRKRILDIKFPNDSIEWLNLNDLLDNCTSLKGIYIRSLGRCFKINQTIGREQSQPMNWASNIEDVVLSFNENDGKSSYNPANLLSALQKQSCNLKFLELFCCVSSDAYDVNTEQLIESGRIDEISMPFHDLEHFVSLEELKLTSDGSDTHILKQVLQHLLNLKKLHLVLGVGSENQPPWDDSFLFEGCRNLQELKITIKPDMKTSPWGNNFIKDCHDLQNLSVLEIDDQANPMFLKTFCSLVIKFVDLKNLRKLVLKTCVKSSLAFQEIPEALQKGFKNSLDALLKSLKAQVKTFIISNRKLEELYIGNLDGFYFESISYI